MEDVQDEVNQPDQLDQQPDQLPDQPDQAIDQPDQATDQPDQATDQPDQVELAYSQNRTASDLPPLPDEPHPDADDALDEAGDDSLAHVETRPPPSEDELAAAEDARLRIKEELRQESERALLQMREDEEIEKITRELEELEKMDEDVEATQQKIAALELAALEQEELEKQQQYDRETKQMLAGAQQQSSTSVQSVQSGFNRYAVIEEAETKNEISSTYASAEGDAAGIAASPWVAYLDDTTGTTYWYNNATGESSWVEPLNVDYTWGDHTDEQYQQMMKDARNTKYGVKPDREAGGTAGGGGLHRITSVASSSAVADGLGSDYEDTPWIMPTRKEAESHIQMNMFGNGKASVCGTKTHEFGSSSVGVRAMFELFHYLLKLLIFCFLMSIPAMIVYSGGVGSEYNYDFQGFSKLSAASSGLAESATKIGNSTTTTPSSVAEEPTVKFGSLTVTARQASEIVSAFDFLTSLCCFVYLLFIKHYLLKISREVHLETAQASSYTVELSHGLPSDVTEEEILGHFHRLYALDKADYKGRPKVKRLTVEQEQQKYEASRAASASTAKIGWGDNSSADGAANQAGWYGTAARVMTYDANGQVVEDPTTDPLHADFGDDEWGVQNVDHNGNEMYLNTFVADVVLLRDEGDIIRHYQHLAKLDISVRHHRALVKRSLPGTQYEKGADPIKAAKYTSTLLKLEFQQQQGLLSFQDPGPNKMNVVKAFVTFNHEESFNRCVADYDESWRRATCCPCCPGHKELRLRYKHVVRVKPAPEPSDILYENQGEYIHKCQHRWRFWSSLCVVALVLLVSLGLIVSTYYIRDSILPMTSSPGGTEKLCGEFLPRSLSADASLQLTSSSFQYRRNKQFDLRCQRQVNSLDTRYMTIQESSSFPASRYNISTCTQKYHSCQVDRRPGGQLCPCVKVSESDGGAGCTSIESNGNLVKATSRGAKSGDISVCYCIQKLNRLSKRFDGNTGLALQSLLDTDSAICSTWLEASAVGAGWSVAASFVIAVVNSILGVTIAKKSKSARPSSISAQNSEIFRVYFIAQMFNSVFLTIFVNAEIEIFGFQSLGEFPDFSRAWFSKAGSAMTGTMMVLSLSTHVYPLIAYLKFRRNKSHALKNPETFVSQQEMNAKVVGPGYKLEYRLTSVMIPVTTAILFGSFLPLLYPIAIVAVLLAFLMNKFLIVKYHQRPPATDASIPVYATDALLISTLVRIALSCWIFGIETIFVSEYLETEMMGQYAPSFGNRVGKRTSIPHLLLLILLLGLILANYFLKVTLGPIFEEFAYWLTPKKCTSKKKDNSKGTHDTFKPTFTAQYRTIMKPVHLGFGRSSAMAITHNIPEKQMGLRGWCHVCGKIERTGVVGASCIDPHCTEWHSRRKMFKSDGVVQNLEHKKGDFARTWEIIRAHSLHNYRIQDNENYIHVVHLRNEERFIDDADKV